MENRQPSAPDDWDDSEPGDEGHAAEVKPTGEKEAPPLGDPAGQH